VFRAAGTGGWISADDGSRSDGSAALMRKKRIMRIGIFGGTFDPVHLGHLLLAEQCREQGRLDRVKFVPAAAPPHKLEKQVTPFAQRVEMLALAIAGHPAFEIDELEKDRSGPSFTADTLAELQQRNPGAELCLVIGADTLADLPNWHRPDLVVERASLLVAARPGITPVSLESLKHQIGLPEHACVCCQIVHIPLIGISSTDLRTRVSAGRSIRFQVPRAVECYIEQHQLYTSQGHDAERV